MTTRLESSTSIKQWSTPAEKTIEGQPPGPEDHPNTIEGEARKGNVRTITPNYKLGSEKPSTDVSLGYSGNLPDALGDYKVRQIQDHYKLTVIDPKVQSNANMPVHGNTLPNPRKNLAGDFPSEHSKRSFLKLEPLEQRKFKSVETRPITTSTYLTESVERHRDMEASKLKDYLKAKEGDANKPWNKPNWPGPKGPDNNEESLRELESIKKSIETLQRAAQEPRKNSDLDSLARKNEEMAERARQRRAEYKLRESEIIKEKPEPVPQNLKDQLRELQASRASLNTELTVKDADRSGYVTDVSSATWQFSGQSFSPRSVVSINGAKEERHLVEDGLLKVRTSVDHLRQDDKAPRGIMKRRELETREQMMYPMDENRSYTRTVSAHHKPVKTETVQRFEETRRTEEIERRVQRKERKDRRSRHHSSSRREEWGHEGGHQNGYHRSASLSRGGHTGCLPTNESYFRSTTTKRDQSQNRGEHAGWDEYQERVNRGLAHARYGSLSDSLRRGELKYIPNGEVRELHYRDTSRDGRGQRVHKSYSTRDVFDQSGGYDRHSTASGYGTGRRGSQTGGPLVEFPPTLPRRGHHNEMDYYRNQDFRPVSKSRSFADWDDQGRAGFRGHPDWAMQRRYDDDMSRLEAEFRDSLLMPIPNGNLSEREHRTEQIPGGYETYHKDNRANSGRRLNRDGQPVDFSETSQEYSYKRETESDRRR